MRLNKDMAKAVWGKQRLGGYAGVKFTAKQIVEQIPNINKYTLWVECFSGLARTADYINLPKVLNDKSEFANSYCKDHFPNAIVENMDFIETIKKYDSPTTFFLIDPPWFSSIYTYNKLTYCDRKIYDYYSKLLDIVNDLQGDWFILSSVDEKEQRKILAKSQWGLKIVSSEKKAIFGYYAKTMICSNLFPLKINKNKSEYFCESCFANCKNEDDFNEHLKREFHLKALGVI